MTRESGAGVLATLLTNSTANMIRKKRLVRDKARHATVANRPSSPRNAALLAALRLIQLSATYSAKPMAIAIASSSALSRTQSDNSLK